MKLILALVVVGACGDDGAGKHDAAIDAPPDSGGDAGMCPGQLFFTGEYVDWLSGAAGFCGINGAKLAVHGDTTHVDTTAPNGRILLCVPDAAMSQVDITPPTALSECTVPKSGYTIPGIAIVTKAVIQNGALFSARSMTTAELTTFFTAQSLGTFDPTKAQVFVHQEGTPRAVAITATHAAAQAYDGSVWAAGVTGVNVYFPNVDVTAATTDVSVTGGAIGTATVPIVANTFTYLTVVAN